MTKQTSPFRKEVSDDLLSVVFVCGDPVIFIGGRHVAKISISTDEGRLVSAWAKRRWNHELGAGFEREGEAQ